MKYGSLEWAQDLLKSVQENLENFKNAKEPLTSDETFQNMVKYFTNLAASLEDEIAKGNYVTEKDMPAKDISDDEDTDEIEETIVTDIDGDGDVDKVETTKINPNILGGVKEFGN